MIASKYIVSALALGVAALSGHAAEPEKELSTLDLEAKIQNLEGKVAKLKASSQSGDSRDVDATVAAVLKDAERHSLLVDSGGVTAGFNIQKGFFISNEDQSFYLHPRASFQFRGVGNYLQDGKNGGSDTRTGFEVRRAKFGFDGNFSKDLTFRFQWQDATNGGTPTLEHGWAQYMFMPTFAGGNLAVRAGQYKDIVFKEEFSPDEQQLMVERSLANTLIGGGALGPLIKGVDLIYGGNDNPLHLQLLMHTGNPASDFTNTVTTSTIVPPGLTTTKSTRTDFGVAGRVDYKVFGDWSAADDLTGVWTKNDLLVIGGGVDFTQSDNTNAVRWSVDAQYERARKFVLFANINGSYIDFRNLAATAPTNRKDVGGQVEGGYFLTPAVELIARYGLVKFDRDFKTSGVGTFHEIAAGVNFFMGPDGSFGNRAKFTLDVTYLPNGSPAALGNDFRANPNKKDEIVGRAQMQLWL